MCAKEERLKQEKTESAYRMTHSQDRAPKKRKVNHRAKGAADIGTSHVQQKQDKSITYFFCKRDDHVKKDRPKYAKWLAKKGKLLNFVCSEVNLALIPTYT